MTQLIFTSEVKVFDDTVSSIHTPVLPPGKAPLKGWRQEQIHGTKEA